MRIGIDFDNTIAGYDRLFARLALEQGLVDSLPAGGPKALRDLLRSRSEDGDIAWQHLQAAAYGRRMAEADLIDGVADFLTSCRRRALPVHIISHKTRFARRDEQQQHDMRAAALAWMTAHDFFAPDGIGLSRDQVFFEDTQAAKVARIGALGCSHFVDDLEEVLTHPDFPAGVVRYLLSDRAPDRRQQATLKVFPRWQEIGHDLFG